MSEEKRSSNVLAVTLVLAVTFQIFSSVLILNELRALPDKMPAAGSAMSQARGLDAGTEAPAFTLVDDQGKEGERHGPFEDQEYRRPSVPLFPKVRS